MLSAYLPVVRDRLVDRHGDVRHIRLPEEGGERLQKSSHGTDLGSVRGLGTRRAMEAAEDLEGPVDEVHFHRSRIYPVGNFRTTGVSNEEGDVMRSLILALPLLLTAAGAAYA
jgi:hypothetical protein